MITISEILISVVIVGALIIGVPTLYYLYEEYIKISEYNTCNTCKNFDNENIIKRLIYEEVINNPKITYDFKNSPENTIDTDLLSESIKVEIKTEEDVRMNINRIFLLNECLSVYKVSDRDFGEVYYRVFDEMVFTMFRLFRYFGDFKKLWECFPDAIDPHFVKMDGNIIDRAAHRAYMIGINWHWSDETDGLLKEYLKEIKLKEFMMG